MEEFNRLSKTVKILCDWVEYPLDSFSYFIYNKKNALSDVNPRNFDYILSSIVEFIIKETQFSSKNKTI